jgi:hypothetical protein
MSTLLIWIFGIIIGLISILIFGVFDILLHSLLRFLYDRHKRLRRQQRPSRIFLVRHGESQANVDTSKLISFQKEFLLFSH